MRVVYHAPSHGLTYDSLYSTSRANHCREKHSLDVDAFPAALIASFAGVHEPDHLCKYRVSSITTEKRLRLCKKNGGLSSWYLIMPDYPPVKYKSLDVRLPRNLEQDHPQKLGHDP
jgi:hypothetical protein